MNVDWTHPQRTKSSIQHYAWGEKGNEAYLARLTGQLDGGEPMAELWMGAHSKSPSKIQGRGLDEWIAEAPAEILGDACANDGVGLPYLFKILSAADALSIQLHPNKSEAEDLHRRDPKHYPDDNHKPEIAIAIEELEALLGFESVEMILASLDEHEELRSFLPEDATDHLRTSLVKGPEDQIQAVRHAFTALFEQAEAHPEKLNRSTASMALRLKDAGQLGPKERWFVELQARYTEGDVGLFCFFFLNYRVLKPGDGVFLKADVPHAYLRGNIVECMANSDNVVRAGLTPKFVDVETLSAIVEVDTKPLQVQRAEDNGLGGGVFKVPVPEFEVHHWCAEQERRKVDLQILRGPRFIVVLKGELEFSTGEAACQGDVIFLADVCSASVTLAPGAELYLARPALG